MSGQHPRPGHGGQNPELPWPPYANAAASGHFEAALSQFPYATQNPHFGPPRPPPATGMSSQHNARPGLGGQYPGLLWPSASSGHGASAAFAYQFFGGHAYTTSTSAYQFLGGHAYTSSLPSASTSGHFEAATTHYPYPWHSSSTAFDGPPPPPPPSSPPPSPPPPPSPSPSPPPLPPGVSPTDILSSDPLLLTRKKRNDPLLLPRKKRRVVNIPINYIPILDYLDENVPIVPYIFMIGSSKGRIPTDGHVKTTSKGATVIDGSVDQVFKMYDKGLSYGGNFSPDDILVSDEDPLHVIINKVPTEKASDENLQKDLQKIVNSVLKTRYIKAPPPEKPGEAEQMPAYLEDFITRVKDFLKPKENSGVVIELTEEHLRIRRRILRHHPFLIEAAKRRFLLEDYYKFYKTLNGAAAYKLISLCNNECYPRWQVLIASKDELIGTAYWKRFPSKKPADFYTRDYVRYPHSDEENCNVFFYTSEDGYLAVFLRNFIVHETEEPMAVGVTLEELELIVAYYFPKFLPSFLEVLSKFGDEPHEMPKEILRVYEERRCASREVPRQTMGKKADAGQTGS